jgi:hypothetical protein
LCSRLPKARAPCDACACACVCVRANSFGDAQSWWTSCTGSSCSSVAAASSGSSCSAR